MAIGDILVLSSPYAQEAGTEKYIVDDNESGQGTGSSYLKAFRSGEPVAKSLGNATDANYVHTLAAIGTGSSAKPVVATDFLVGIAVSGVGAGCSTETDTADGIVYVQKMLPGIVYLGNPDVAATWNTQAKYDALVGARVLIKMSASTTLPVFTILAVDGSTQGLVVEELDIVKYPGKVAFSLRQGLSYLT